MSAEPAVRAWQRDGGARVLRADLALRPPHAVLAVDPVPISACREAGTATAAAATAVADILLGDGP